MSQRKLFPTTASRVTTYDALDGYARGFAEGLLHLLLLGDPGLGKSQAVRRAVGPDALWAEGHATAFGLYCALYQHQNQPVVIDDVDGIYADKATVGLLKSLCQ